MDDAAQPPGDREPRAPWAAAQGRFLKWSALVIVALLAFVELFGRRFVPVDPARAEKIWTLIDFFLRRPLAPGDEIALDYPLKGKTYRIEARAASRGEFKLAAMPEKALPCTRVDGLITGWGDEKQTAIEAYVGRGGEFAGKLLRISFKFTDWPRVTLTLASGAN